MLFIIENKNLRLNIVLNTDRRTKAINKERLKVIHHIFATNCLNSVKRSCLKRFQTTSFVYQPKKIKQEIQLYLL